MGFQSTFNSRVIPAAERAFGSSVTFTQGGYVTDAFTAVWEDHEFEIFEEEGFVTKAHVRDFMFAMEDCVYGSTVLTPRAGDLLKLTENSEAMLFEIVPVGNLPAVEFMPGNLRWRVHTKRVS